MYSIFVDFEMQPVDIERFPEEYKICHTEIIEVGAVVLNDKNKEVSSFKRYVKPRYSDYIDDHIKDLTGITIKKLGRAPYFEETFADFLRWCNHYRDYTIYAWSNNDKAQLVREMELKKTKQNEAVEYMVSNWVDFQKDYGTLVGAPYSLSLEKALYMAGEIFDGKAHDALFDARNTANLFAKSRDKKKFLEEVKRIKEMAGNDEPTTYSIGSSINFEELKNKIK
ncbi:MAG: exonuclease domain-containing protein [Lachnospiraceae bacterium]|nr:exonuclease domain-containing protein [Lachnospiraceae bacterium]